METKEDIKEVKIPKEGILLYKYIRGSQMFHLNTPESDIDTGGVFINPIEVILGLRKKNDDYSSDKKQDNVAYDIEKYMQLLLESNPTVLESLYADDTCVLYEHPVIKEIRSHRDEFVTKAALRSFLGYGYNQIKKAKGYNKLCAYPENMERKQPIDFCYTFNDYQGTEPISNWLEKRGLKQIYFGLAHLQNMDRMYACFYDWGQHLHMEFKSFSEFITYQLTHNDYFVKHILDEFLDYCSTLPPTGGVPLYKVYGEDFYNQFLPKGYHGIVKESGKSDDIHLDSIKKGDIPICYLSYNGNGYSSHCNLYKGWKHWKEVRNELRYKSNYGTGFDAKNIMHCIRLLRMAVEIAEGKGVNLNRDLMGDREYLLDIKSHKYTYEYLMNEAEELKSKLTKLIKTCNLPDHIDKKIINDLLIKIRKDFYHIN